MNPASPPTKSKSVATILSGIVPASIVAVATADDVRVVLAPVLVLAAAFSRRLVRAVVGPSASSSSFGSESADLVGLLLWAVNAASTIDFAIEVVIVVSPLVNVETIVVLGTRAGVSLMPASPMAGIAAGMKGSSGPAGVAATGALGQPANSRKGGVAYRLRRDCGQS